MAIFFEFFPIHYLHPTLQVWITDSDAEDTDQEKT